MDEKGGLLPTSFSRWKPSPRARVVEVRHYLTSMDGIAGRLYPMPIWEAIEARLSAATTNPAKRKFLEITAYYGTEVEPLKAVSSFLIRGAAARRVPFWANGYLAI